MKQKRLKEIEAELAEIEARANGLEPLAETAEQAAIDERSKVLAEIKESREKLLAEKEQIEAEIRAAEEVGKHPESAKEIKNERRKETMGEKEFRNSPEYIAAYAKAIKGDSTDLRALLTENAPEDGQVPIPTFAEERIRTAWETDEILNRVGKTYVKGNLKIGFEISGSDAVIHVEGTAAPDEEELVLGVVELIPQSIKKWIESEAA